ncbi:MAG: hypothetical protein QXO76_05765 [Thermoproteota archaeon]
MLQEQVKKYYVNTELWKLGKKHIRIVTHDKRFIKFNTIRSRVNEKALWRLCSKYAPIHVYMSVLNYLFPERVGLKRRAKYAYPVGGEYVIDVDNYFFRGIETHEHPRTWICLACLEVARRYTIRLSELIEENYESIKIIFSGARGFHIHVLDFNVRD